MNSLGIFLVSVLFLVNIYGVHSAFAGTNGGMCREREQMALMKFKAALIDEYGLLSSWGSTNCCEWKGVGCNNRTNHVVALNLHGGYSSLRGKIDSSLLQLPHLQYLDLSFNDFVGSTIPEFIGSLNKLQHLNLSFTLFKGPIPHHIGNLSTLRVLDLGHNYELADTNLDWLSGLALLEYLNLSGARLYKCTTWLQQIYKLTALRELRLPWCSLPTVEPISIPSHNSSNSLVVIDLSNNDLFISNSYVFSCFLNMSSKFTYIDLSQNALGVEERVSVPDSLGNLMSLSHLDLHFNNFASSFSDALGNLTTLSYLDLSYNQLQGEFPRSPKNSSSLLTYLDLSWNMLNGELPHLLTWLHDFPRLSYVSLRNNLLCGSFPNMSRFPLLKELYLQNNLLNGSLLQDNLRLPNLEYLDLSTNKLNGKLPFNVLVNESIGNLPNLKEFIVGYNMLDAVITDAHLSSLPKLQVLDLSFNSNITLMINSSWLHPVQFSELRLANCKLGPNFPKWLHKHNQLQTLDISSSGIFDTIPSWFWGNMYMCLHLNLSYNHIFGIVPNMTSNYSFFTIDLSSNELSGTLPLFAPSLDTIALSTNKFSGTIHNFCQGGFSGNTVDLSNNWLSGDIPQDCFVKLLSTYYLNLANNHFTGELPNATEICRLSSLHLRNNNFTGEIPRSLRKCSWLRILDLGENEFRGRIPWWLGENMPELGVLILKSNTLYGSLPLSICHLSNLQVLDLSSNKITGSIPACINNFTLLSEMNSVYWNNPFIASRNGSEFYDSTSVNWKGKEETYIKNLELLKMIDLSSNQLNGEIPHEVTSLFGLLGLNLSRNNLVGFIPSDIDQMKLLNFLDLSRNKLSGGIPPTLSKLSHLGVLDLSFNNLSGRIPWDTHMQTFNASVYSGNPRLCGLPLASRPCPEDEVPTIMTDDSKEEHKFMTRGFYISMLIGFIVAFWGVFWALFVNKWWNVVSTKICITFVDWLYVKILVNKRRLIRYFSNV